MTGPSTFERPLSTFREELVATHVRADRWIAERSGAECERLDPIDPAGSAIFVKELPTGDDAAPRVARLLVQLDARITDREPGERAYCVSRLVAYGQHPPYVAYAWSDGVDMTSRLRDVHGAVADRIEISRRVGAGLRQLHCDLDAIRHDGHPVPVQRPRWASWLTAVHALPRRPAPAIVDLGPWNVIVSLGDPPTFIDLDVERAREVEFDLGWFVYFLGDKTRDVSIGTSLELAKSLVDGYAEGPGDIHISEPLVYLVAGVSGLSRNVSRLRALRPVGAGRKWILQRVWLSFALIGYGVLSGGRSLRRRLRGAR